MSNQIRAQKFVQNIELHLCQEQLCSRFGEALKLYTALLTILWLIPVFCIYFFFKCLGVHFNFWQFFLKAAKKLKQCHANSIKSPKTISNLPLKFALLLSTFIIKIRNPVRDNYKIIRKILLFNSEGIKQKPIIYKKDKSIHTNINTKKQNKEPGKQRHGLEVFTLKYDNLFY